MGNRIGIFLVFLVVSVQLFCQNVKRNLISANSCYYRHTIYTFGYEQKKDILFFKCISYSTDLQLKDSTEFALGKHLPADYLEISSDTLHDVLNFYFQLADQKNQVTLLRLNNALQKVCAVENFDANHVNSLAAFDDEKYIHHQDLYLIRTSADSLNKQFYLSKYTVKAMDKPFEYDFKWQYAFERKNIHRASVIYANNQYVIIYAHVDDGLKKGQWILRLNAGTGDIVKGLKLNAKGDNRHYLYSKAIYDTVTKGLDIIGSIYPTAMIDFNRQSSNFSNLSVVHQLFLIQTDSSGEVTTRIEKPFPLPPPKKTGSTFTSFHLKIREFAKQKDSSYTVWADLYEQAFPNIMAYYSSWRFTVVPKESDYIIKPSTFYASTKPLLNFISFAKGDPYGKLYLNNAGDYDKFKYIKPTNPVVVKTGLDSLNNQFYILKKTDLLSGRKTFNYVFLGKKDLEKKLLFTSEKGQTINLYFMDKRTYISFITNVTGTEFELKATKL